LMLVKTPERLVEAPERTKTAAMAMRKRKGPPLTRTQRQIGLAAWTYVYTLVDPRDGSIFYVGKGTRGRINDHEEEARRGLLTRKCARIREIWAADSEPEKRIVALFHRAKDRAARQFELDLIRGIGYERLTNGSSRFRVDVQ
jgi:hypothetical protein